jgi:Ca2+:H+ antiporter
MAVADALSSLMVITAVALILPTALYATFTSESSELKDKVLAFSRGSAVVLFVLYVMYLYFQLKTHPHLFLGAPEETDDRNVADEEQGPTLKPFAATIILLTAAAGIMGCTHYLIDNVDKTAKVAHITKTFVAAILIPIASNAPECVSIILASRNGNMDFAIGVIVNSILQIALFVIPVLVALGWIIQVRMTLYFEVFQTTILFLAVLVVNRLLQDGKYTYIQGVMLVAL